MDWLPISSLIRLIWDSVGLVVQDFDGPLWVSNFTELVWIWIGPPGFWDVDLAGFVWWKRWLVESITVVVLSGFNVVSFVTGTVGGFGSWKFIFASFLSVLPSFRGGKGTRGRGLVEFCTVIFSKRVVVVSIPLASAEKKEAVNGR